jgi:hypothetical protein
VGFELAHLNDDALLEGLLQLVGCRRRVSANLIAHLAEVEARGIVLQRGYSSLFKYCLERLGFSEDEAWRRIVVSRIAGRHPEVLPLVESGALTLSVVSLLRDHLSAENASELFKGVSHCTVKRAKEWIAARFPKPDVPSTIRKLPSPATPGEVAESRHRGRVEPLSDDRFLLKVTIGRLTRDKLERARDLMRHGVPSGDLERVMDAALDALIEKLEKRKFGATERPRAQREGGARPSQAKATAAAPPDVTTTASNQRADRYVPSAMRRAVADRDGCRCAYVSPDGRRCDATAFLEFDHVEPVALGGLSSVEKLRLYCRAHNQMAGVEIFGAAHMRVAVENAKRKQALLRVKEPMYRWPARASPPACT